MEKKYKLKIEINDAFVRERYGDQYGDLFEQIWEKLADILESGDNFTLKELNPTYNRCGHCNEPLPPDKHCDCMRSW